MIMLHIKLIGITKQGSKWFARSPPDPRGQKVENNGFRNAATW